MKNQPLTQEQAEEFVRLWQTKPGTYVAKHFSISRQRVDQIANNLSKAGVPLRNRLSYNSIAKNLDIEQLTKVAKEARGEEYVCHQ